LEKSQGVRIVADSARVVSAEALRSFCTKVFEKLGVEPSNARIASDVLVTADLRGVDSHGVARLSKYYVKYLKQGMVPARFETRIVHETPTTAVMDGGVGLGLVVGVRAMQLAINKAKDHYVGLVAVRNSTHFGIAGYYAMMALEHNMIGISTTNAKAIVLPTFGRDVMLGTNPISIAVPAGEERPFVLDMATSTVPQGKLEVYERLGKPIPSGWATDEKGRLSTDTSRVLRNIIERRGGGLLPLGGMGEELGGHKGYGLALAVDIFAAMLSGAACSALTDLGDETGRPLPSNLGHFFGAIRIDGFRPLSEFKASMDDLIRRIKNSSKTDGASRIYIHGEKEFETSERRGREGIPLDPKVSQDLERVAKEMSLPAPF
jgi:LDH2 family malate/lactate/ureidoglycolate dehydrogenase